MNDQQAWQQALELTDRLYSGLSDPGRVRVDALVRQVMSLKLELLNLTLSVGSASVCRTCGGKCCLHGKYYVTLLDLLAYRINSVIAPVPDFAGQPGCPYGDSRGCCLEPGMRPMTCVIFNCELIEELMNAELMQRTTACERELRTTIAEVEQLAGIRFGRPALLAAAENQLIYNDTERICNGDHK